MMVFFRRDRLIPNFMKDESNIWKVFLISMIIVTKKYIIVNLCTLSNTFIFLNCCYYSHFSVLFSVLFVALYFALNMFYHMIRRIVERITLENSESNDLYEENNKFYWKSAGMTVGWLIGSLINSIALQFILYLSMVITGTKLLVISLVIGKLNGSKLKRIRKLCIRVGRFLKKHKSKYGGGAFDRSH